MRSCVVLILGCKAAMVLLRKKGYDPRTPFNKTSIR